MDGENQGRLIKHPQLMQILLKEAGIKNRVPRLRVAIFLLGVISEIK
jgi:hypothetical protein